MTNRRGLGHDRYARAVCGGRSEEPYGDAATYELTACGGAPQNSGPDRTSSNPSAVQLV